MVQEIRRRIKLHNMRKAWRKKNPHNDTHLMREFDMDCVTVGRYTYGGLYVYTNNNTSHLYIGDFCSIAAEVMFVLNADHRTDTLSTFPFKAKFLGEDEGISKGDIVVGDDVWFGFRSTILSGVSIGQGAVIAAGAVVTKDVPPYAIVGGVPAKVIRYRFSPELVDGLKKVDYMQFSEKSVKGHIGDFYRPLSDKSQLEWIDLENNS